MKIFGSKFVVRLRQGIRNTLNHHQTRFGKCQSQEHKVIRKKVIKKNFKFGCESSASQRDIAEKLCEWAK